MSHIVLDEPLEALIAEAKFVAELRANIQADVAAICAKYPAGFAAAASAYVAQLGSHIRQRLGV